MWGRAGEAVGGVVTRCGDEPCRAASADRSSQATSGSLERAGCSTGEIKIPTNGTMEASVEPAVTSWRG